MGKTIRATKTADKTVKTKVCKGKGAKNGPKGMKPKNY